MLKTILLKSSGHKDYRSQRKSYKWISKIVTHPQTYPQTHRPTKPLLILDISNIFPHSTYSIFRLASMHTKHMYLQTSFHLQYYSTLYTFKLRSDFMHSIHMHLQTIFRCQYFSTLCAIKPKHRSMHLIHMYSQIILRRRYISTRFAYWGPEGSPSPPQEREGGARSAPNFSLYKSP